MIKLYPLYRFGTKIYNFSFYPYSEVNRPILDWVREQGIECSWREQDSTLLRVPITEDQAVYLKMAFGDRFE